MKLIFCSECTDLVKLERVTRKCLCGKVAGKYLDKEIALINVDAVLVGIDNNSFNIAVELYDGASYGDDVKNYFVGWIPITPGYTRIVKTTKDVENFKSK